MREARANVRAVDPDNRGNFPRFFCKQAGKASEPYDRIYIYYF